MIVRQLLAALTAVGLIGCQNLPQPPGGPGAGVGSFSIDKQQVIEQLAKPPKFDGSYGRVSTAAADAIKHQLTPPPALRKLSAVSVNGGYATNDTTTFPSAAGGGISSSPAYHYLTKKAYWVTDTGYLLGATISSAGAVSAGFSARIKNSGGTNQTFKNTVVTLSNDGRRVYLCSLEGNFLVLSATDGSCKYSYSLGTNASITGTGGSPPDTAPAPWIDPIASRPDGQQETVYTISNSGNSTATSTTLRRFCVDQLAGSTTVNALLAQSYDMGLSAASPYVEGVRAHPIVIAGRAVVGTWRRNTSNSKLSTGYVIYYDTACRGYDRGTVTATGQLKKLGVPNPVWAAPAVDVDDSLIPYMAFVTGAYQVTAIDLFGSYGVENSAPLLIDKTTVPTVDSLGGTQSPAQSLSNYPYDNTGVTTTTLSPVSSGGLYSVVSVSESAGTNLFDESGNSLGVTVSNAALFSYSSKDVNDATLVPAYGYAMFKYSTSDRYVGAESEPRTVQQVRIRLDPTNNSNCGCVGMGGPDNNVADFQGWKVDSYLSGTATLWTAGNITTANRPEFSNGDAFTYSNASKGVHNGEELVPDTLSQNLNPANSFTKTTNTYDWLADGLIFENTEATFAFYDDNTAVGGSSKGKPFNVGTPYFTGGTTMTGDGPKLVLELSASGLANPTMLVPVTLDTYEMQVYAVNTNALYRISYEPWTTPGYVDLSVPERFVTFKDTTKTFYAHTSLGSNASYGPIFTHSTAPTKRYVGNITAPCFTGNRIYVQDVFASNTGAYNRTTFNEFDTGTYPTSTAGTGTPPSRLSAVDLTASNANAKAGPAYIVYDFLNNIAFTASYDPADTTKGRAWVMNR